MDMFNPLAFIYWDVDRPSIALERIRFLESNRTAYEDAVQQPILAPRALEKYFSMDDSVGGGALKRKLRRFLGLDSFDFSGLPD